jgi:hypothetical protein
MKRGVHNSGAGLFEGQGSAPVPQAAAVEECGANPWGSSVKPDFIQVLENWLASTSETRFSPGALHQIRETIRNHPPKDVSKAINETFYGSDRLEIRQGLVAAGLIKEKKPVPLEEGQQEDDTAEHLLREAVVHIPSCNSELRDRIEEFLHRQR